MRALVAFALLLAGCSKVLGISDPTPVKGDGGTRDGRSDAMLDAPMIDSGPPCINAPIFGPEMSFDLGGTGVTIAVGDLDHDMKQDVAVALGDHVVILHGDGMGGLANPQTIDTAADGVLIDDFDFDGRNDLILWKIGGSLLVERRQDITGGAGMFLAEQPATGTYANIQTVKSGFLDANFIPDIIVKDDTQRIVLTSNLGTLGTFSAGPNLGTNEDVLAVFQIDTQHNDDVALLTPAGEVEQVLQNSNSTYMPPQTIATGVLGRGAAFGQIDGDALPDLVLTSASGGRIFTQAAGGTFTEKSGFVGGAGGPTLQILDIDNNGLDDLIVSGGIIQQCSGGMFSPIVTAFDVTPPVLFADLNRNNKPDIIRVEGTQLKVRIQ